MIKKTLLIELHYLPCIQFFAYLASFEKVVIDLSDTYTKQTYRNRCRINGANKIEDLIIPIKKNKEPHIAIDYGQKWHSKHLRAIQTAYGKAPFFEYYADELFEIFNKKQISLLELNKVLLTKCLEILDFDFDLNYSEHISLEDKSHLYDARNEINPKNPFSNNSIYMPESYFQVFGNNFVNNLSIIDLIFCEGPQARHFIQKSCTLNRQI
jgi:hypothetical protein